MADDINATENESGQEAPERPAENAAIYRCIRAYQRAYRKEIEDLEIEEDDDKFPAEQAGKAAYLRAVPPLTGYENICDFIACITCADLTKVIRHDEAGYFLDSAKVAITAHRCEPDSRSRRLDRPPIAKSE